MSKLNLRGRDGTEVDSEEDITMADTAGVVTEEVTTGTLSSFYHMMMSLV